MKSGRAFSAAALPGLGIKICELFHRAGLVSLELISELTTAETQQQPEIGKWREWVGT
jgi:hypothetical protein